MTAQKKRKSLTDSGFVPSSVENFSPFLLFIDVAAMWLISHIVMNRVGRCFNQRNNFENVL